MAQWMPVWALAFSRSLALFPPVLRHGTPGTVSHTGGLADPRAGGFNLDPLSWDAWGGVLPLHCIE
jgi:hypothetical protein